MFVDELDIYAKAGNGGDGVLRWRHEKFKPKAGPAGGNGGKGGDVFMRAVRDVGLLSKYTGAKEFKAENGEAGRGKSQFGKNGEDLFIDVPVGATVTDLLRDRKYTFLEEGEVHKILVGGQGGLGNEYFKSSTNRSPKQTTEGKRGEAGDFRIELSLIVDVGIIGFPNAGKSTLLNALTNAHSRIGAYPFTTLEPHLGDLYGFILADIPGLIEGASEGKGLGHKFLRHARRTKMLLHCISLEEADVMNSYQTIRNEIGKFDRLLLDKDEWIVLTKSDLVGVETSARHLKTFQNDGMKAFCVSAETGGGVKELRDELTQYLQKLKKH